ncbi:lactosylceramide 4-alpha-galactosyltransferase-like [Haemaphysalis longicornis]
MWHASKGNTRQGSAVTALVVVAGFVILTVTLSAKHLGYNPRGIFGGVTTRTHHDECLGDKISRRRDLERRRHELHKSKKNFFFLETAGASCITDRAACSIESAALRHPDYTVWLLTLLDIEDCSILSHLFELPNFKILRLDLNSLVKDSVLVHWYVKDSWNRSPFRINHLSDALRLLVLWKYGGIYADMDVLTLRSFDKLENVLARELFPDVGNSVMAFRKRNPFLFRCLEEFSKTYKPRKWAHNGPRLLERVLPWFCPPNSVNKQPLVKCSGVTVLPANAFYPVTYLEWRKPFLQNHTFEVLRATSESFALHLWNSYSRGQTVEHGSAYDVMRKTLCPSTHNLIEKQAQI